MKTRLQSFFLFFCLIKLCFGSHLAPQGRIYGGYTLPEDGYLPYMATIHASSGKIICGGVIIARQWILTAAHCLLLPTKATTVGTGGVYFTIYDTLYSVENVVPHPNFVEDRKANDIGLIKLVRPIVYTERTLPIKMAQWNNFKVGDILMVAGRGLGKKLSSHKEIVKVAEVNYLESKNCTNLFEGYICTDTGMFGRYGDSGGPLTDKNDLLVGITINRCTYNSKPSIAHVSVAYYYDWITNTINSENIV